MLVCSKKYRVLLSLILILSFASQAEAQFWNGLKNALKKKAEEVITKEVEKTGNRNKKPKEKKKSKSARAKKVTKATAKKPVAKPVVKASNNSRVKTTKAPYQQEFPIQTDDLYKQYMAEEKTSTAQFPKCFSILIWAGKTRKLNEKVSRHNFYGRGYYTGGNSNNGKYLIAGFKDENFVPVFGKRFDQWTDQDVKDFETVIVNCRRKYFEERDQESRYSRQRYEAKVKLYEEGKDYIGDELARDSEYQNGVVQTPSIYLKGAQKDAMAYPLAMAHQRKIYPKYKAALALIDAQKTEAKSMSAAKKNIRKLSTMINDPQFAYLWPDEKKRHKTFLDKQAVVLADQMIGIVIVDFNGFPNTLEGIKALQDRYTRTLNNLKGLQSHKWKDLKQAYEIRGIAIITRVIDGAINNLNNFQGDLNGLNELINYRVKFRNETGALTFLLKATRETLQPITPQLSAFEKAFTMRKNEIGAQIVDDAINGLSEFPDNMGGLTQMMAYRVKIQNNVGRMAQWRDFERAYSVRVNRIRTRIVDDAIDGLSKFPDGMDGLMKMISYRTKIQNNVGRTTQWRDFERAYVSAFNEKAEDALTDFADKMNSLPATTANLRLIQSAVRDIFTERPMPANLQSYRRVVTEQVQRVQKEIKKVACYKKLEKLDLDEDDRDTAILGYSGETTLGMFICGMKKRGYRFQEFDSAGLFGSTSTLSILSTRGITLSIDMEEVEAVKDKEMLVGVMVKDVTSEKKLTLTEWQNYAGRLAGR